MNGAAGSPSSAAAAIAAPTASLLVLFARTHDLLADAIGDCERFAADATARSALRDGWDVASTRLMPLLSQLCDPQFMESLEDDLVSAGLVGPELDARMVLFDLAMARSAPENRVAALRIAATVGYAASRVKGLSSGLHAVADLASVVAEVLALKQLQTSVIG